MKSITSDESHATYLERLQSSPNYAGRRDFLSNTTWLPSASGGFRVGYSRLMKTMQISVVGQISASESTLDPFADTKTWTLPYDFANRLCTLTLVDPSSFGQSFHNGFLRAIANLCLLSETAPCPAFCKANPDFSCLDVAQLYNGRIVLRFPFFEKKVMLPALAFPFSLLTSVRSASLWSEMVRLTSPPRNLSILIFSQRFSIVRVLLRRG